MTNRHERRKQAAEMRGAISKAKTTIGRDKEGHVIFGSQSTVPDDIKADIARVVRAIRFTGSIGGNCAMRAGIGFLALRLLGMIPQFRCGAALYRAGPDPIRDTLSFCGPGNMGQMINGQFVGHIWLEMDGELIDFSCSDWSSLDPRGEVLGVGLGAIRWAAPPPTFVWATRSLFDWQAHGEPDIGELWYGPMSGVTPDIADTLAQLEPLGATIVLNLARMKLPDRVRKLAMAA